MPLDENGNPIVATPGTDEDILDKPGTDPADGENNNDGDDNKSTKTFTAEEYAAEVAAKVKEAEENIKRVHRRELEAARTAEEDKDLTHTEKLEKELKQLRDTESRRKRESDIRGLFEADNIPTSSALIEVLIKDDATATLDATETILDFIKEDRRRQKDANSIRKTPAAAVSKKPMSIGERIARKNQKK